MDSTEKLVGVTGATGFLGSHLVRKLLENGFRVRAFARDELKSEMLPESVDVVIGDICDRRAVERFVEGCAWVFHTVSNFRTASGPPESYRTINVGGTRCLLNAAVGAGVQRVVHVSTIGVHGDVEHTPGDEDAKFAPGDLYQETKLEAERLAKQYVGGSMEVVIARPCSMYGPGDLRMLKMFRMLANGTFFKVGPCRENFHAVYISDVVDGLFLAAKTPGIDGEVFILGGPGYLPLEDYIDEAAAAVGAGKPKVRLPYWLLISLAWTIERICVPLRIEPPLHVRRVRFFKNNRAFTIAKAREKLNYSPEVPIGEGMKRTVAWYREQGLLPPASESVAE